MSQYFKTKGIILKKVPHQEENWLTTIYTKDFGKINALVSGGRKIKSKLTSHLWPLTILDLMLVRGYNFKVINIDKKNQQFRWETLNIYKISLFYYLAELLDNLTKTELADEKIFNLLRETMEILKNRNISFLELKILKKIFTIKLLSFLGYKPDFENCSFFSKETLNFLNFSLKNSFEESLKIKISQTNLKILDKFIAKILLYNFDLKLKTEKFIDCLF